MVEFAGRSEVRRHRRHAKMGVSAEETQKLRAAAHYAAGRAGGDYTATIWFRIGGAGTASASVGIRSGAGIGPSPAWAYALSLYCRHRTLMPSSFAASVRLPWARCSVRRM